MGGGGAGVQSRLMPGLGDCLFVAAEMKESGSTFAHEYGFREGLTEGGADKLHCLAPDFGNRLFIAAEILGGACAGGGSGALRLTEESENCLSIAAEAVEGETAMSIS